MAKITVDASTCVGCGLCAQSCPECFEMKDDGVAHVKGSACTTCNLKDVADQCPVNAIAVA